MCKFKENNYKFEPMYEIILSNTMMLKYKDVLLLKLDKKTYYIEILKSEHDTDTLMLL